jgi:DNA-binding MarR family transcriptional regulator
MSSVKRVFPREELQVPLLMGLLFREVSATFATEDWDGLRQSHFRVISAVPPEGISVTDLGERVGMSKQGCGQFVTFLVASGHLRVEQGPTDRRVRLVRRTPKGSRTITKVTRRVLAIEDEWAAQVGERRYGTFRKVLEELALEQ